MSGECQRREEEQSIIMAITLRSPLWSPFGSDFDALVRRAFAAPLGMGRPFVPAADVRTEGTDIVITLELPGVDAGSLDVQLDGRRLVVSGRRADDRRTERNGFVVREIRSGSFHRTFPLPEGVTAEQVSADYDAGLLTVRVRDAVADAPQPVAVPVRGLPAAEETPADAEAEQG
jgi:HSP20 family protein